MKLYKIHEIKKIKSKYIGIHHGKCRWNTKPSIQQGKTLADKFVSVYVSRKIKISTFRILNLVLTLTQCYYLQKSWNKYKTKVVFILELFSLLSKINTLTSIDNVPLIIGILY